MNGQELIDAVAGRSGYSVTTGNTGQLVGFAVNAP
jgi:hypothetical protein